VRLSAEEVGTDYPAPGWGTNRTMPPTGHAPSASGAARPAGTQSLAVHSDIRCPWAHVAVHRLLDAAERRGIGGELHIDHRWFPIGDGLGDDPEALAAELATVSELEPGAGWSEPAGRSFPGSGRLAAEWVQAAKAVSPSASVGLDRALRRALFADGLPVDDGPTVDRIAADLLGADVVRVRAELESGRPGTELDRHAEVAAGGDVAASPTIVLADGRSWTNPGIEVEHADDGGPVVRSDDPSVHDEIVEAFLTLKHYD
jgi:predicted DsbA family dithiol-disulfide isomerase